MYEINTKGIEPLGYYKPKKKYFFGGLENLYPERITFSNVFKEEVTDYKIPKVLSLSSELIYEYDDYKCFNHSIQEINIKTLSFFKKNYLKTIARVYTEYIDHDNDDNKVYFKGTSIIVSESHGITARHNFRKNIIENKKNGNLVKNIL
jgi:hypothetical protein